MADQMFRETSSSYHNWNCWVKHLGGWSERKGIPWRRKREHCFPHPFFLPCVCPGAQSQPWVWLNLTWALTSTRNQTHLLSPSNNPSLFYELLLRLYLESHRSNHCVDTGTEEKKERRGNVALGVPWEILSFITLISCPIWLLNLDFLSELHWTVLFISVCSKLALHCVYSAVVSLPIQPDLVFVLQKSLKTSGCLTAPGYIF